MNTNLIITNLASQLSNLGNKYPNGQGIYHIQSHNYSSQGDESGILQIILSGNFQDGQEELEEAIYNKIYNLDPNNLIEGFSPFTQIISNQGPSLTGTIPNTWVTQYNDSYFIHGTDNTFYITIIQSGQY